MARLFGAGPANDAFQIAFRIPNLTRNLFAEGAFSSAFVPVFSQALAKDKRTAADLASAAATALLLAAGAVALLAMIFSPQIVGLLAPGFHAVPGKFELAVLLTRIMCPFLVLVAMAAHAMGALNACDRFGVPALASTFFNLGSVIFGLAIGYTAGREFQQGLIVSMACGVLAGGALQWLWQIPSLYRAGFAYRPRFDWRHPGLRQIRRLMIPAILGNAALQINVTVNANLASGITDAAGHVINGPVSWLGYAFRFLQFPLGLFGAAISTATLPAVSRSAAAGRLDEFRATLARSLSLAMLLSIPSAVGLAVLGESIVGAIFQGGHFTAYDTHQTAVALAWYSAGLAGYAAVKILAPAFYALDDGRTPALVSLASVAVNLACGWILVRHAGIGHAGLAISTSAVALFGGIALFALLRRRLGTFEGRALGGIVLRIAAASAVMGAVCRASSLALHAAVHAQRAAQWLDAGISIPLGAAVFYGLVRVWGVLRHPLLGIPGGRLRSGV